MFSFIKNHFKKNSKNSIFSVGKKLVYIIRCSTLFIAIDFFIFQKKHDDKYYTEYIIPLSLQIVETGFFVNTILMKPDSSITNDAMKTPKLAKNIFVVYVSFIVQ